MVNKEGIIIESGDAKLELDFSVGKPGERGPQGPQGEPGERGPQGENGKSAYQLAVANGFKGSEAEWLESLKCDSISGAYAEIKRMADDGKLVPGRRYIITDYQASCKAISGTISIPDVAAANVYRRLSLRSVAVNDVPFDLILQAVSANSFEPNAIAVAKEAVDGRVKCWDAKYSLTPIFSTWDDTNITESYRGSIYFLRDNLDNEAWYDFENIGYEVTKIDQPIKDILEDGYIPEITVGAILKTFNIVPDDPGIYIGNKIGPGNESALALPFIIFVYYSRRVRFENSRYIIINDSTKTCIQSCESMVLGWTAFTSMRECGYSGVKDTMGDVFIATKNLLIGTSYRNHFCSRSFKFGVLEKVENCYFGRSDEKLNIVPQSDGLYSLKNCVFEDGHNCTFISSTYKKVDSGRTTYPVHGLTVKASVKGAFPINEQLMSECVSDVTKRIVAYDTDYGVYVVRESEGLVDIDGALKRVRITGNKVQQTGINEKWETIGVLSPEEGTGPISVTYKEIDTLMTAGELVPGQKYKIVDYYNYGSAALPATKGLFVTNGNKNKPRELIVEAKDESHLLPDAMLVSRHDSHVGRVKFENINADPSVHIIRIKPSRLFRTDVDLTSHAAGAIYFRSKMSDGTWVEASEYEEILAFDEQGLFVELVPEIVDGHILARVGYFGDEAASVEVGLPIGNHAEDYSYVYADINPAKLVKGNIQEKLWLDVWTYENDEEYCVTHYRQSQIGWIDYLVSENDLGFFLRGDKDYSMLQCVSQPNGILGDSEGNDVAAELVWCEFTENSNVRRVRSLPITVDYTSYHPKNWLNILVLEDEKNNTYNAVPFDWEAAYFVTQGPDYLPKQGSLSFNNEAVVGSRFGMSMVFILPREVISGASSFVNCQFNMVVGVVGGIALGVHFYGNGSSRLLCIMAPVGGIVELTGTGKSLDFVEILNYIDFVFAKNNEMKTMSQLIAGQ